MLNQFVYVQKLKGSIREHGDAILIGASSTKHIEQVRTRLIFIYLYMTKTLFH